MAFAACSHVMFAVMAGSDQERQYVRGHGWESSDEVGIQLAYRQESGLVLVCHSESEETGMALEHVRAGKALGHGVSTN
jgi:hypothetical protein